MLECYLDDSGTHEGSPLVAWGGIAGHKHYLDQLDTAWRDQLLKPCDGKPPIKKFHSYDLEQGINEFAGYNRAASNLTHRNFRQIIVESSVTIFAYGVSTKDWDEIIRGEQPDYTAEQLVFGQAIFELAKAAKKEGEALSLQFDQGRDTPELRQAIMPAIETAQYEERFLSYGFSPVASVPALQAADLVIHEMFGVYKRLLMDGEVNPRPHAKRLIEDSFAGDAKWMGRKEIEDTIRRIERARNADKNGHKRG